MFLTIKTISYTLIGSGEGTALVDADIVFDETGLPYIPSRRIKGLLRKSAMEVCDIKGIGRYYVDSIFGTGNEEGEVSIDNFYLYNYKDLKEALENYFLFKGRKFYLTKEAIVEHYTELRERTAIDKDGIAKKGSLRVCRVLRPNIEFCGHINDSLLNKSEREILSYAIMNLRRIGMQMNRGYGKIEISIKEDETKSAMVEKVKIGSSLDLIKLPFIVETLSPIVIANQVGGINNIGTYQYIPSTTLRGLFIKHFSEFAKKFIDGEVIITSAYPTKDDKDFLPAPFVLVRGKYDDHGGDIYLYSNEEIKDKRVKPLDNFIFLKDGRYYEYQPDTIMYFHNSIQDVFVGAPMDGGVFIYEAINKGEYFKGYMIGKEKVIKELFGQGIHSFEGRIGRSKNVQYGKVRLRFFDPSMPDVLVEEREFYVHFISPALFYNQFGLPEVSLDIIKRYLKDFFGCNIEIEGTIKSGYTEAFVNYWKCKNNRERIVKEGSTVLVTLLQKVENFEQRLSELESFGIGERTIHGFGRVKLMEYFKDKYTHRDTERKQVVFDKQDIPLIKDILFKRLRDRIKSEAVKNANDNQIDIPSSLIERLKGVVNRTDGKFEYFKQWLETIKGKKAEENLKRASIFDDMDWLRKDFYKTTERISEDFKDILTVTEEEKLLLSKLYWITFLYALRKVKKAGGNG